MLGRNAELVVAVILLGFAAMAALVWIPADVETQIIHTHRRQTTLGDAFLPTLAVGILGVAALVQLLMTLGRDRSDGIEDTGVDMTTLSFLLPLSGIVALSLAMMYWAGPIAVDLFVADDGETARSYRQMRGTYPYKLLGYALGGTAMVFLITSFIEGRFRATRLLSSILAVAALMAIFDLPFDTVLLPPNGDW
ncbi:hypothetical protein [Marinovum sp.]|uniref:hypothetical protein n=1 Tax=Marinovum sp. TaxID=2024839 RepID=UPI002B26BFB8|nr:hypothetical protein [Marinovum sp.]